MHSIIKNRVKLKVFRTNNSTIRGLFADYVFFNINDDFLLYENRSETAFTHVAVHSGFFKISLLADLCNFQISESFFKCFSEIACTFFTRRTYLSTSVIGSVCIQTSTISRAIPEPIIFPPIQRTLLSVC